MKNYLKNLKKLEVNYVYNKSMEHDACGVGLISSTNGTKSRKVVEQGMKSEILNPPFPDYTNLLLSSVPEMDPNWLSDLLNKRNNLKYKKEINQ